MIFTFLTFFIILGTKTDLREKEENTITATEGKKLRARIGAFRYVECSAKTRDGLTEVFEEAIRATLVEQKPSKRPCTLL